MPKTIRLNKKKYKITQSQYSKGAKNKGTKNKGTNNKGTKRITYRKKGKYTIRNKKRLNNKKGKSRQKKYRTILKGGTGNTETIDVKMEKDIFHWINPEQSNPFDSADKPSDMEDDMWNYITRTVDKDAMKKRIYLLGLIENLEENQKENEEIAAKTSELYFYKYERYGNTRRLTYTPALEQRLKTVRRNVNPGLNPALTEGKTKTIFEIVNSSMNLVRDVIREIEGQKGFKEIHVVFVTREEKEIGITIIFDGTKISIRTSEPNEEVKSYEDAFNRLITLKNESLGITHGNNNQGLRGGGKIMSKIAEYLGISSGLGSMVALVLVATFCASPPGWIFGAIMGGGFTLAVLFFWLADKFEKNDDDKNAIMKKYRELSVRELDELERKDKSKLTDEERQILRLYDRPEKLNHMNEEEFGYYLEQLGKRRLKPRTAENLFK